MVALRQPHNRIVLTTPQQIQLNQLQPGKGLAGVPGTCLKPCGRRPEWRRSPRPGVRCPHQAVVTPARELETPACPGARRARPALRACLGRHGHTPHGHVRQRRRVSCLAVPVVKPAVLPGAKALSAVSAQAAAAQKNKLKEPGGGSFR